MTKHVYADRFFFTEGEKGAGYLAIVNGTFGAYQTEKPSGEIIDYSGYAIAPGLVDTHIHGYGGHDVMDNNADGILAMSEGLLSMGVTSFLPTTLTASTELLNDVCQTVGRVAGTEKGAKIRGIFLEGPFFNEKYKGAQNPNYMCDPCACKLHKWKELSNGLVNKIAIAPEREGAIDFIKDAKANGIYVAIAHTDATYDQSKSAVEAGANIFVHVYNGMRGLHHREPGTVGAALTLKGVHDELICDGHHVHPVSAKLVMTCNGYDNAVLITDCMAAEGCPDGDYKLGEFDVVVANGTARLKDSGNLAGSILKLYNGVKNVIDWGIAEPYQAYRMASYNAAVSVGLGDVCGKLDEGYAADFIVVDKQYELKATYLNGEKRFEQAN